MGLNSVNYLPATTKESQVAEFLNILGFDKVDSKHFYYFNENNLEQITAIVADLVREKEKYLKVELSTTIWRSIADHEFHNFTIKQLRLRFGGSFETGYGRNKYIVYNDIPRRKSEAGCYLAYFHFRNNLSTINLYYQNQKAALDKFKGPPMGFKPLDANITIGLPFLISILEEFLRCSYISLLTYSTKKKEIFKSSKISTELLYEVSLGNTTIEKVIAQSKSFQNINQINAAFKELDSKINFIDFLKRTQPRKKYLEKLSKLIEIRHIIIHQAKLVDFYKVSDFQKDIDLIDNIVSSFYKHLVKTYDWQKAYM